jgi:hypothetical protein
LRTEFKETDQTILGTVIAPHSPHTASSRSPFLHTRIINKEINYYDKCVHKSRRERVEELAFSSTQAAALGPHHHIVESHAAGPVKNNSFVHDATFDRFAWLCMFVVDRSEYVYVHVSQGLAFDISSCTLPK